MECPLFSDLSSIEGLKNIQGFFVRGFDTLTRLPDCFNQLATLKTVHLQNMKNLEYFSFQKLNLSQFQVFYSIIK